MGLPNVGKTSILNSLLPQSSKRYATAAAVPTIAGSKHPEPTTKIPTEVRIETQGMGIRIIDTPGWEYADDDEEEEEGEAEDGDVVRGDENGKAGASEAELQKWDEMEARYSGDLLRRNMGRVDRVKNPVPLGTCLPCSIIQGLAANTGSHWRKIRHTDWQRTTLSPGPTLRI